MSAHTPGPWEVVPTFHRNGEPTFDIEHGTIGELVCTMESGEQEADARLIAAAPDLLEALALTLDELTRFRDEWLQAATMGGTRVEDVVDPDDREAIAALDATCAKGVAALAKARGRS